MMPSSASSPPGAAVAALLPRVVLALIIGLASVAHGARTTGKDHHYNTVTVPNPCKFPARWEGTWFQSGVRQPILIAGNQLDIKGECQQNEGDKFLMVDKKNCWRCVVIHEKHSNVLQYKETFCHTRMGLAQLCSYITGDAQLYSMFREEATSVPCPFHGPMVFTYNRGHGRCSQPQSNVDTCTDESRLLFKYQACPDVEGSESTVEELECLATWKEGSNRYLVGRLHSSMSLASNEDRYRCYVYERASPSVTGLNRAGNAAALGMASVLDHEITAQAARPIPEGTPEIYQVAQSGDATCNGLFSPLEGSRTMTLTKASSPGKCWFPMWLTGKTFQTWHTLDLTRSYTFHTSNASLHTVKSNGSENPDFLNLPGQEDHDVKILCNSVKKHDVEQNMYMIVAHYTVGCESGYMCMAFYKRDGHVVELQTGQTVSRMEDACSPAYYEQHRVPYVTLVTSAPEPRQCPYLGKFTVTGLNGLAESSSSGRKGYKNERVRHGQERRYEVDFEKRHGNNQYLVHEQHRRTRTVRAADSARKKLAINHRSKRQEDFSLDTQHRTHPTGGQDWPLQSIQEVDEEGADLDDEPTSKQPPIKQRPRRELDENDEEDDDFEYDDEDDVDYPRFDDRSRRRRRRKRSEDGQRGQKHRPRCNSGATTLTVGCSTADRMEFQSECVPDEDFVSAFSCHGRWFDAEGTQFVIATPLQRREPESWSGPDGSRAQPYRNSRRYCLMYKENGGVVSLFASSVACQRGEPSTMPILAFNATSIGQCIDGASSLNTNGVRLILSALLLLLVVFR